MRPTDHAVVHHAVVPVGLAAQGVVRMSGRLGQAITNLVPRRVEVVGGQWYPSVMERLGRYEHVGRPADGIWAWRRGERVTFVIGRALLDRRLVRPVLSVRFGRSADDRTQLSGWVRPAWSALVMAVPLGMVVVSAVRADARGFYVGLAMSALLGGLVVADAFNYQGECEHLVAASEWVVGALEGEPPGP